jgi:DNA repair protein RadC
MEVAANYKVPEVGLYIKKKVNVSQRPVIEDKWMVKHIMMNKVPDFKQHIDYKEMFYVLYANSAAHLLSIFKLSEGSDLDTAVSSKHIIQGAILQNATGFVLVHNHPSGNVTPSPSDISLTTQIAKCARMFDLELIDHIIISQYGTYSFTDGY